MIFLIYLLSFRELSAFAQGVALVSANALLLLCRPLAGPFVTPKVVIASSFEQSLPWIGSHYLLEGSKELLGAFDLIVLRLRGLKKVGLGQS